MEARPASGAAPQGQSLRVRLLHTNDVHGTITPVTDRVILGEKAKLGGAAYLASLVTRLRAEDPGRTLLVDSGDAVHGQLLTDLDEGRSMVEVMETVGYDAGTLGNHDFQWGVPSLADRLEGTDFPILVANVVREDGSPLPRTRPHRTFDLDGVKVGVTGLLTRETEHSQRSDRLQGVRFLPEEESLRASLGQLRQEGAEVVVVLSHMGLEGDRDLAARFPGEGLVILGGHSHDRLAEPEVVAGNHIVQAGALGKELGDLQVDLDPATRRITAVRHALLAVNPATLPADPEVAALVAKYEKRADVEMGKTVGHLPERLTRCNHVDSPLGNFVTDAMRRAAGADLAFMNSDGLRTELEGGDVTLKHVYELMPFGGELLRGTLTGAQVLQALEQSVGHRETDAGVQSPFLQVSGIRFAYDASRPEGQRVLEAEVGGRPLDPARSYTVALEDYLAAGKLGYRVLAEGGWQETSNSVNEAVEEALRGGSAAGWTAEPGPRIEDRTPR